MAGIIARLVVAAFALAPADSRANGVAGDRLFPATLTIEDTQNDDELAFPAISYLKRGANGDMPPHRELRFTGEFSRLLTPDLAIGAGLGWRRLGAGGPARSGWDNVEFELTHQTLRNDPHELLLSTALTYEIGSTGARGIGAERFDTIQPIVSFGRGFGDLPRAMDWLRPAAISGSAGLAVPTGSAAKVARYGASLQYSLLYRDRHIGRLTPAWLGSLIPLVEFAIETPVGRSYGSRTVATASPGVAWIGEGWQLTAEALLPLNDRTGRGIGFVAQAHFFLDDLVPAVFGKPLFGE